MYAADGQAGPVRGAGGGAPGGAGFGGAAFGSVAEALRAGAVFADFLNSPAAAAEAGGAAYGEVLTALGEIQGKLAAAYATFCAAATRPARTPLTGTGRPRRGWRPGAS